MFQNVLCLAGVFLVTYQCPQVMGYIFHAEWQLQKWVRPVVALGVVAIVQRFIF